MKSDETMLTTCVFSQQDRGQKITEGMRQLEKKKMEQMEEILSQGVEEPDLWVNLFSSSVKEEMAVYSKS